MEKVERNLMLRRSRLVKKLSKTQEMINAYGIHRRCGKPGCKCAKVKGYLHKPVWCFHDKKKGQIIAEYIPAKYADRVRKQAQQYNKYKTIGMEICKINRELLKREIIKLNHENKK